MRRIVVVVVAFLAIGATALHGLGRGHVLVTVRAAAPEALAGAVIEARSSDQPGAWTASVDAAGRAVLAGLPAGTYVVTARTDSRRAEGEVVLGPDGDAAITLDLLPELAETVEARGEAIGARSALPLAMSWRPEEVAALPLGRDYRAFAQLAPGVNVVPDAGGADLPAEPAVHAGNNYQDRGAGFGSRDNSYRLDGFDITGMASGGGDMFLHHAIVQEENVVTSGVRAESPGGAGYVLDLVTRSGSAEIRAGVELFIQDDGMVADFESADDRLHSAVENRQDLGATLGGALWKDRLWGFVAFQRRENDDAVTLSGSASPSPREETYALRRESAFGKLTFRPSAADDIVVQGFVAPRETSGTRDVNTPPNRYVRTEQDLELLGLGYTRVLGSRLLVEARGFDWSDTSKGIPEYPSLGPANTILYAPGQTVPAYERLLGSAGDASRSVSRKTQAGVSGTVFFTAGGDHALEAGYAHHHWQEENGTQSNYGFALTSLASGLRGLTLADAVALGLLPPSELDVIHRALLEQPGSAAFAAADRNGDGTLTAAELGGVALASSAGNADGVNFLRQSTVRAGVNNVRQRNQVLYLQDDWRFGAFSANLGVRVEERRYIASDDSTILAMDPDWLPRVGLAWSPGDGRTTVAATWGRYADPLRTSMIRFAGNLSGSIFTDDVFLGSGWFAYRTRGSATVRRDAGFAPNLENETEEELALTLTHRLGGHVGVVAHAYRREDENLIEDYDPGLYFNPAAAGAFALTPATFGYRPGGPTDVNYFLGNLVGASRRTYGVDLAIERRGGGRWGGALQYAWKDAEGNSNSDAAADLQGDFLDLDPRQDHMWGNLPGTIPHQLKAYGNVRLPWGFEAGGLAYWSSGAVFTESTIFRPNTHAIYYNHQRPDGTWARTGDEQHPSWWSFDARLRWGHDWPLGPGALRTELVLDVYNVFDNQDVYRVTEGRNDPEFTTWREPRAVLLPRRYEAGLRLAW